MITITVYCTQTVSFRLQSAESKRRKPLTMSDVRALLKAKREEQRIGTVFICQKSLSTENVMFSYPVHPFAAYNQSGVLRCTVCATIIKHASAWNGHLGSKSHRTNAARLKEEERLRDEEKRKGKRKADDETVHDEPTKKRKADEGEEDGEEVLQDGPLPTSGFPSDFFSDPSRTVVVGEDDSEEGDKDNPAPPEATSQAPSSLDLEWIKFQKAVINAPVDTDTRETFERATVFAEPQLSTETPAGFPSSVGSAPEPQPAATPTPKDDESERRRRAEEERELIMDRLLDEEREQEEADERVNALKAKIDLLKKRRLAAKAAKIKK